MLHGKKKKRQFMFNSLIFIFQGLEMERPKSSRGRQPANQERAISPSPPATPEHQPTERKEKNANKGTTSPPVSPRADVHTDSSGKDSGSPRRTPQSREREISGTEEIKLLFLLVREANS